MADSILGLMEPGAPLPTVVPSIPIPPPPSPISIKMLIKATLRHLGSDGENWVQGTYRGDGDQKDVCAALTDARKGLFLLVTGDKCPDVMEAFFIASSIILSVANEKLETPYTCLSEWNDSVGWGTIKKVLTTAASRSQGLTT